MHGLRVARTKGSPQRETGKPRIQYLINDRLFLCFGVADRSQLRGVQARSCLGLHSMPDAYRYVSCEFPSFRVVV